MFGLAVEFTNRRCNIFFIFKVFVNRFISFDILEEIFIDHLLRNMPYRNIKVSILTYVCEIFLNNCIPSILTFCKSQHAYYFLGTSMTFECPIQ